jgi:hypothetical protein
MFEAIRFSSRLSLLISSALALAGCAATSVTAPAPDLTGPDYFSDATQPDVVLGYFTEPYKLRTKSCLDGDEYGDPGGHCYGPIPSVTLVVQDVIFGRAPEARLKLSVYNIEHAERFPLGKREPVLAYPSRYGTLSGFEFHRLVRTRAGEWAIPVGSESDLPSLPCSSERFLKPHVIEFARPRPTRALDEYDEDEIKELESNPDVTIRNGIVEFRAGILLSEIYALRERIPALDQRDRILVRPCLRK